MRSADSYAAGALVEWASENAEALKAAGFRLKIRGPEDGKSTVDLDGEAYVANLCAWDHASCLDIQVLQTATAENQFPAIGSCETREVFESRLSAFLSWAAGSGHAV